MMDLALRKNDLEITRGDIAICATDADCIAQAMSIRIKTLAGEWFLDRNVGIHYFTEVFGHKRSERFMQQLIVSEIEATPGVKRVREFKFDVNNDRKLTVNFSAELSDSNSIHINESIGL